MNPKNAGLWRCKGSIKSRHTRLAKALTDIYDGLNRWELWGTLGWHDIRHRYRRSIIGPFWITLSMGIMVGALGFLYAQFFGQPIRDYLPFLSLGVIIWGFISTLILDGCVVFIASESVIRQLRAPLSIHVFRMTWRNLIIFAHNMVIYLVIMLIFGIWPGTRALLAIPGMLILCLNGIWASFLVGLLSARFRDIPMLAANIIQILFFFTPIIWNVEQLRSSRLVAELNPFYHLVEIVRMPLLGHSPPLSTWLVVLGVTVVGYLVALGFFVRFRGRIAYWV
jgi:ABC-2 type transport system permease protein/lipopolysaccharide transport system permease protein